MKVVEVIATIIDQHKMGYDGSQWTCQTCPNVHMEDTEQTTGMDLELHAANIIEALFAQRSTSFDFTCNYCGNGSGVSYRTWYGPVGEGVGSLKTCTKCKIDRNALL